MASDAAALSLDARSPCGRWRVDFGRDVHWVLGLPFDALTLDATVETVQRAARHRQRCVLVTPNINFLVMAGRDPAFRADVLASDLSLADGAPVVAVARWLGVPLTERVAGSDLFERLRASALPALSVYFFGGPEGVAERASQVLGASATGLRGVGGHSPGFGSIAAMSDPSTQARINAPAPDFVVVALGAKKGQAWIVANEQALDAPLLSHLGAVVNFVVGDVQRAPVWARRLGLEWLWRIFGEPELWRRYAGDALALAGLIYRHALPWWWQTQVIARAFPARRAPQLEVARVGEELKLTMGGDWVMALSQPLRQALAEAARHRGPVTLDLSACRQVDLGVIALWALLHAYRKRCGLALDFTGAQPALRKRLRWAAADHVLSSP